MKVAHVPRRQNCMRRKHNPGDHRVPQLTGTPLFLTHCHQIGGVLRRFAIEMRDSALQHLVQQLFECTHQSCLPFSCGHDLEPEAYLEDADRCRPYRLAGLSIQPANHCVIRLLAHQRGEHIGVKKDHGSRTAGRAACPRNSGISS
jgi:hypothetical protein